MLLQTNSYVVPADRRADHNRLMRRFRQTLLRLGCDHFEVYEQAGAAWAGADPSGRFVQILRFADRKHQLAVQAAEKRDPQAQSVIADFCDLIGIAEQLEQGLFVTGYYTGLLPAAGSKVPGGGLAGDAGETANEPATGDAFGSDVPGPGEADADGIAGGAPVGPGEGDAGGNRHVAAALAVGAVLPFGEAMPGEAMPGEAIPDSDPPRVPVPFDPAESGHPFGGDDMADGDLTGDALGLDDVGLDETGLDEAAGVREGEYDEIVVRPVRSFTTAVEPVPDTPSPVVEPHVTTDPVVGDVLVGDDLTASVPAPSHADDAGGTGLPAMFSDDYFDEPAAHGGPAPAEFAFDDEPADAPADRPAKR